MGKDDERIVVLSLHEQVHARLRDWIVTGRIAPGARIVETEVAERLGVSQGTVREALRALVAEGLAYTVKFTGAFASPMVPRELFQMFRLRAHIEVEAWRQWLPQASPDDFIRAEEVLRDMEMVTEQSSYERQAALDLAFHFALLQRAEIEVYERVWNSLAAHIRRFLTLVHPSLFHEDRRLFARQHATLLDAAKTGNVGAATQALHDHIMLVWEVNGEELLASPILEPTKIPPLRDSRPHAQEGVGQP
jgi:DNA-binding GntR family transcriptional regulator